MIRQQIFVCELLPQVFDLLSLEPLAGDAYDGQLISSLATLEKSDIKNCLVDFEKIKKIINQINSSDLDKQLLADINKINHLV